MYASGVPAARLPNRDRAPFATAATPRASRCGRREARWSSSIAAPAPMRSGRRYGGGRKAARPHADQPYALGPHPGHPVLRPAVRAWQRVGHLRAQGLGESVRETLAGQMQYTYFPVTLEQCRPDPVSRSGRGRSRSTTSGNDPLPEPPGADARLPARGGRSRGRLCLRSRAVFSRAGGRWATSPDKISATWNSSKRPILSFTMRSTQSPNTGRSRLGHSSVEYAVKHRPLRGREAVALTHHDPLRDDDAVDRVIAGVRKGLQARSSLRSTCSPPPKARSSRSRRPIPRQLITRRANFRQRRP